jgi:hypothetical protein
MSIKMCTKQSTWKGIARKQSDQRINELTQSPQSVCLVKPDRSQPTFLTASSCAVALPLPGRSSTSHPS